MSKPILISGIKPSGRLHIGNYLGALKNFVALQNSGKYQTIFFIADLHSLNVEFDPKEKIKQILEITADYLAVGLNLKKSLIFLQSQVPAHSELASILANITPIGELKRMTQFKEKSEIQSENINAGLFNYPILMASDILLYNSKVVPVGDDQLQHLELARTLARKFNAKFGKTFVEPQPLLTEIPRVMSLDDPMKKMEKSRSEGCIFLDDSPEVIHEKIKRAVTDSDSIVRYDPEQKPAISNMLRIMASLTEKLIPDLEKEFANMNYSEFKLALANVISNYFADFRKKKMVLKAKSSKLKAILITGSKKANKIASKKLALVKKKIGIAL